MRWFKRRPNHPPDQLIFTRVQSGQNQTAVNLGWEKKWEDVEAYWYCLQSNRLYKKVGEDFIHQKTSSLGNLIKEDKDEGNFHP